MTNPLWSNLFRKPAALRSELTELWLATPLFQDIPRRAVEHLVADMHPRDYAAEESVFRVGERGAGAVLIHSGSVSIRSGDIELARLEHGDFFGEIALAIDEPRTADAIAVEPTRLVFLLRADVEEWIERAPALGGRFALNLARIIASRLRRANALLSELTPQ